MHSYVAVVLHFRAWRLTEECVRSLLKEGARDIIIVDNSEDRGVSLRHLQSSLTDAEEVVRYIEPGCNLGYAAGINLAAASLADRGADLLLINNDATLKAGTVGALQQAVAGEAPVVAAPMIDGPTGLVTARTYYRHMSGAITPSGTGCFGHALLGGACLMIHRSLVCGELFDSDFFFYGDDIEFGHRMARQGVSLVDVPQGVVHHQGSAGSGNGSLFYEYHMTRAHVLLAIKLSSGLAGRAIMLLGRAVCLPARALVRSIRFHSLDAWRGLFLAVYDIVLRRMRTLTPPP